MKAAQQEYQVNDTIDGWPFDAAAAFYRAVTNRYGFVDSVTVEKKGFLGRKYKERPDMRQIRVGPNPEDIIQVPVGGFQLPGFEAPIETSFYRNPSTGKIGLSITGTFKAKDRDAIREIIVETRRELLENSIYKGKALLLKTDENGEVTFRHEPEFMATDRINPAQLVLSKQAEEEVSINLLTPIWKTAECRLHNIPLKRTIILAGPYGTGKTLCATMAAKHCVDSVDRWTYVLVNHPAGLAGALRFARNYQPCLVVAEDVDRVTEERDDAANELMDELDGGPAKGSEVMVVLTTNHLDKIHAALLRAGRTDSIIHIGAPDAESVQRLVRLYAGGLIPAAEPLETLGKAIEGYIPALVAGIVERAKLAMVSRGAATLNENDLLVAARGVKTYATLLCGQKTEPEEYNDHEKLGRAFGAVMANGPLIDIRKKLEEIEDRLF